MQLVFEFLSIITVAVVLIIAALYAPWLWPLYLLVLLYLMFKKQPMSPARDGEPMKQVGGVNSLVGDRRVNKRRELGYARPAPSRSKSSLKPWSAYCAIHSVEWLYDPNANNDCPSCEMEKKAASKHGR